MPFDKEKFRKFTVTTNRPDSVGDSYDPKRTYEAEDETGAIIQMIDASGISRGKTHMHRFKATVVEDAAPTEPLTEAVPEPAVAAVAVADDLSFETMPMDNLKALATERGLEFPGNVSRKALIAMLGE